MSMQLVWALIGALVLAAIFAGGYKTGWELRDLDAKTQDLAVAEKIITRERIIIQEVPKIVTKVITRVETVKEEVRHVVIQVPNLLDDKCVLPKYYGELLVAAANGVDPTTPGSLDPYTGLYGCRETLEATLKDLAAGWQNSATLDGLQEWSKLITKGDTP